MDQFKEGLEEAGLLYYLKKYLDIMAPLFVDKTAPLTASKLISYTNWRETIIESSCWFLLKLWKYQLHTGQLKGMFVKSFSDVGTSKRQAEEQSFIYFSDFLDECEGIKHVCMFFYLHLCKNFFCRRLIMHSIWRLYFFFWCKPASTTGLPSQANTEVSWQSEPVSNVIDLFPNSTASHWS